MTPPNLLTYFTEDERNSLCADGWVLMQYKTIRAAAKDEFTEQRSRFIGRIAPVTTEDEATAFLAGVKAQERDARHNVFAYVLQNGVRRCSDDGEPSGTGGVPSLEVLVREGLCDVAVVITRYFGGILLGAGGLVRAYSHAAKLAVDAADAVIISECRVLRLEMAYPFYGGVQRVLPRYNARVQDSDFGAAVRLDVLIRAERAQAFTDEIIELGAGSIPVTEHSVCFTELE